MSDSYVPAHLDSTTLVISGVGVPPFSARGLTQTLTPIDIAQGTNTQRRTINGALKDLSFAQFQKYKSTITQQNDHNPPACDGIWPGRTVVVDCIAELSYESASGAAEREVVSSYVEGDFVIYRPRLTMLVVNFQLLKDEWQAVTGWTMDLEEV